MAFTTTNNNNALLFLVPLCLLVFLITPSFAQLPFLQRRPQQPRGQQWQHDCDIQQLQAAEPTRRLRAEAGVIEVWESNSEQFRCAGVAAVRYVIEPKGLLLPSYTNAPYVTHVTQGRGIQGVIVPGCPETFESPLGSGLATSREGQRDQHQRVFRVQEGDVIGSPAGVVQWTYNDGDAPIVSVTLLDLSNPNNQLDLNFRSFYLAGNPQGGQERGPKEVTGKNIFNGFDDDLLADAYNVDTETIRSMKAENDERGSIIRVKRDLEILSPEWDDTEMERTRRLNGLEQTLCSLSFKQNIDQPSLADVFTKHGGRVHTINGRKLPLLQYLQLSVERGVLYKNALMTPHWNINAHSIIYITRGTGRIQVARENGRLVFDDRVQEGQLLVVPQNFVVVKKAEQEGLEWVSFKTNDNAMISPLAGKLSAIRGMPDEVLMSSYDMSREEVRRLKYGREELSMFSPRTRSF